MQNSPASSSSPQQQYGTVNSFDVPDISVASPMMMQYLAVKKQYTGILLFYRMGDFYETFFEDALITARALEITLTGRDAGQLGKVPMAGVPVKAADSYLGRLMAKNFKVAICEQMEDPAQAKGLVKRQVVRVLSSGTVTDSTLLSAEKNNFLASVVIAPAGKITASKSDLQCGLAYCDITTGQFFFTELPYSSLLSELDRLKPTEVLTPGKKQRSLTASVLDSIIPDVGVELTSQFGCTPLPDTAFLLSDTRPALKKLFRVHSLEGFSLEEHALALKAAGAIAHYLQQNFLEQLPVFTGIRYYSLQQAMTLNANTRRNLELLETVRQGQYEGSLLWVLNKTCTSMGNRLIRQWVSQPLKQRPEINARLEAVTELVQASAIRESLRHLLPDVYDIERLGSKIANLTAMPRDLTALRQSLSRIPDIASVLSGLSSFYCVRAQVVPPELSIIADRIGAAILEVPATSLKNGNIIQAGYHKELDQLRDLVQNQTIWLEQYEQKQREETDIKSLKVSFNHAFGYYIEVSRAYSNKVPDSYHRKQTLTNNERYTTDELKTHEQQVLEAQERLSGLEYELYSAFRESLLPYASLLSDMAHRIAALDVLQSFATVATRQHYCCPQLTDGTELDITECRHPVVETILPLGQFVANDVALAGLRPAQPEHDEETSGALLPSDKPQMMMITGPNMAGKSTYMRQIALVTLMAQMGSYVPAKKATIGLVDAIFTRVGAVDDLASGQSTFMVEMNETAQILHGATYRSLVLLDEVGRGTSTYDGVSIAWAISEYIVKLLGCRALFATHYHELNTLETHYPQVANYRVCVKECDGEIEFLHRVERGSAQKSYGIQVAKMAGIPVSVIHKAEAMMNQMQKRELTLIERQKQGSLPQLSPQLTLFEP
jgi:DNA mismatch repair protein MutS